MQFVLFGRPLRAASALHLGLTNHNACHLQIPAAERRHVGRKRMTKDQPSAVAFTEKLTDRFGDGQNGLPVLLLYGSW